MARLLFCVAPAVVAGAVGALIHPAIGAVLAGCVFGLGWDVTRARHD